MKIKVLMLLALLIFPLGLMANRTSVEVIAPDNAEAGEKVTIKIDVSHRGNSSRHHTDWVYLKINGEEIKRWEYGRDNLPEGGNFTLEYIFEIENDVELEVKGNCNIHGSTGEVKKKIIVN